MVELGQKINFRESHAIVRFKGPTSFAPGVWVGLELPTSTGKNNGSVNGVSYFQCEDKNGIFVKEEILEGDTDSKMKVIISKLQGKLYIMNKQVDDLNVQLDECKSQKAQLEESLIRESEVAEILQMEKETLEEQIESLKSELSQIKEDNASLNLKLDLLGSRLSFDSNDIIQRNIELENALVMLRDHSRVQELKYEGELQKARGIPNDQELHSQLQDALDKISDSEILILELESEVERMSLLTEGINSITAEKQEIMKQNDFLRDKVKELEDLKTIQQDIEALNIETEKELGSTIASLKRIIEEKDVIIQSLSLNGAVNFDGPILDKKSADLNHRINILNFERNILTRKLEFMEFEMCLLGKHQSLNFFSEVFKRITELLDDIIQTENRDFNRHLLLTRFRLKTFFILNIIEMMNLNTSISDESLIKIQEAKQSILSEIFNDVLDDTPLHDLLDYLKTIPISNTEVATFQLKNEKKCYVTLLDLCDSFGSIPNKFEPLDNIKSRLQSEVVEKRVTGLINSLMIPKPAQVETTGLTLRLESLLTNLINSLIDDTNSLSYQESMGNQMPLLLKFSDLLEYLQHFEQFDVKVASEEPTTETITNDSQSSRDEEIQELKLKIGMLNSRLSHLTELETLVKSYKSEADLLKILKSKNQDKINELKQENSKLSNRISELSKSTFLLFPNNNISILYEKFEKQELIQKTLNLQASLKAFKITEQENGSGDWLKTKIFQSGNKYGSISDLHRLRLFGKDIRLACSNTEIKRK